MNRPFHSKGPMTMTSSSFTPFFDCALSDFGDQIAKARDGIDTVLEKTLPDTGLVLQAFFSENRTEIEDISTHDWPSLYRLDDEEILSGEHVVEDSFNIGFGWACDMAENIERAKRDWMDDSLPEGFDRDFKARCIVEARLKRLAFFLWNEWRFLDVHVRLSHPVLGKLAFTDLILPGDNIQALLERANQEASLLLKNFIPDDEKKNKFILHLKKHFTVIEHLFANDG